MEEQVSSLKKKIEVLQQSVISPSNDVKNSVINRMIHESPAPLKRPRLTDPTDFSKTPDTSKETVEDEPRVLVDETVYTNEGDTGSPYLKLKNNVIGGASLMRKPLSNRINKPDTIFKQSVKITGYDGLGGHSSVDEFPKPRSKIIKNMKIKNMKIKNSAAGTTMKIDSFFNL